MTAQIYERLILDGQETSMDSYPPLPKGHHRIYQPSRDELVREESGFIFSGTGCWRGYLGTWEIKDGRFYLVGLRGRFRLREGEPILADWFTGVLRIPRGRIFKYQTIYDPVYEQEVHIRIEKGEVVKTRLIDNRVGDQDPWGIAGFAGGDDEL